MTDLRTDNDLVGEFDASVWTQDFCDRYGLTRPDGEQVSDPQDIMLGWFANAIMAGYDRGRDDEAKDHQREGDRAFMERLLSTDSSSPKKG